MLTDKLSNEQLSNAYVFLEFFVRDIAVYFYKLHFILTGAHREGQNTNNE